MKYASKKNLLKSLKSLPYFNKEYIFQLAQDENTFNLTKNSINTYISRFLKNKEIISLKRGVYVTTAFYTARKNNPSYMFYLANILRPPSYISVWTALQYYNLATEVIHTITSVTSKKTNVHKTKIGTFSYQSVQKNLFSDFTLVTPATKDDFEFFIATPAKALFDLLYFKTRQFRGIRFKDINTLIDELRIDITEMDKKDQEKFYAMINKYISHE